MTRVRFGLACLAAALCVAVLVSCGSETKTTTEVRTTTETETVTTVPIQAYEGLIGGAVITDLLDRGAIDEAIPVEPKAGWDTEFELDVADTVIRFQRTDTGDNVEWKWLRSAAGNRLNDEIEEVATSRGFSEIE